MTANGVRETLIGNLKHAKYSNVCNWVKRSWKSISKEIIINSFISCSITDSLDDLDDENEELEISDIDDDVHDDNIHDDNNISDDNDSN